MSKKIIAIGNVLMKDDGIAIKVVNSLHKKLKEKNIEVIVGETDFDYCLDNILEGDSILLMDACSFGKEPGDITIKSLKNLIYENYEMFSQHSISAVKLITILDNLVDSYFLGIEVYNVEFGLEISQVLKEKYEKICHQILKTVDQLY